MSSLSNTISDSSELDGRELLNRAMEAYYKDVVKAVGARGATQGSAFDIVHDLYVKLSAHPEVLHDKQSIRAFLCRAAINLGIDRHRREQFEARLFSHFDGETHTVISDVTPEYGLEAKARIRVLRDAIGELPARRRAVFILHRLHQQTPDEIASKLNISRNMVDRHLRRALAHCLDRMLEME
ncbi:RNA polymerase sigma factor [Labrenzia sp. OB1]|uniref:RNA polymerase sigma factor n=1 Tax=Labrenzia sp. OB1 TaxID=1561204 RepID=UPI0007B20B6D|nr:RNA polymerase sigma factor [Labrenzia sp. OB1]KZM51809.1 siderophore-interacting protein [Labrenzia sp. OB1]